MDFKFLYHFCTRLLRNAYNEGGKFCGHVANGAAFWVGIQWRADDLIFDFETYPDYQKLSKFTNKSTTAAHTVSYHNDKNNFEKFEIHIWELLTMVSELPNVTRKLFQ